MTDQYTAHRCINCEHLRYRQQTIPDRCLVCPCTHHVLPGEIPTPSGGAA